MFVSLTQAARTLLRAAAVLLPCLLLAACLYRGNIDDPMTIKATWLSYLNGDDMRAACVEGAPLQYRLIYNADYDEQLRSYERSEEHTSELQSLMRISYAVFCLKKKTRIHLYNHTHINNT